MITKKTSRLKDNKIDAMVNIRAMQRLEGAIAGKVHLGNLPKLDDFLDSLVEDAIEKAGATGDDVDAPEELEANSSDDEDLDVVAQDEDALYELGGECNSALDSLLAKQLL